MSRPLRVALVAPYYDPSAGADPEVVLERHGTVRSIAEGLTQRGIEAASFSLFGRSATLETNGTRHVFVPSSAALRLGSRLAHRMAPRYSTPYYEPALGLMRAVADWRPDVLHVHGLTLDMNLGLSARLAERRHAPLVVHYHGGEPRDDMDPVTWRLRRHNLDIARRVLFTHRDQAEPWLRAGLLRDPSRVVELVETSTTLRPMPRAQARSLCHIEGQPACLMVGRLNAIKDPLTSLAGFAIVAERRPLARLHVLSTDDTLRPACEAIVRAIPALNGRVTFHGAVPPERMAAYYSSADILIQSSRREWSGLSVLEAMACGVVPVLSDIPAFRALTGNGRFGRLFPVGDVAALARHVLDLRPEARRREGAAARAYFESALSFRALASRLDWIYRDVFASDAARAAWPR